MGRAANLSDAQAGALLVLVLGLVPLVSFEPLRLGTAPIPGREAESATPAAPRAVARDIDLNGSDMELLMELPGIGPVIARRIIEHRREQGAFVRVEDLLAVRGIGPAKLAKIRPRVRVDLVGASKEVEPVTGVQGDGEHERLEVAR